MLPSIQIRQRLLQQTWLRQSLVQLAFTRAPQTQQQLLFAPQAQQQQREDVAPPQQVQGQQQPRKRVAPPQPGLQAQQQQSESVSPPQSAPQTQQRPLKIKRRREVTIAERVRHTELLLVHYEGCTLARKAAVITGKKVPRNPQEYKDQLTIWTDAAERRRKFDLMIDLQINKLEAMGVNDKVESLREALLTVRARTQVEDNRDVHFPS